MKKNIAKKINDGAKMTLDTLAIITKKGFDELRGEMTEMKNELRGEMGQMRDEFDKKFDEVLTGEDKVMGELQRMREEHAASFGVYKNIEERVFSLEQIVKTIQKKIGLAV